MNAMGMTTIGAFGATTTYNARGRRRGAARAGMKMMMMMPMMMPTMTRVRRGAVEATTTTTRRGGVCVRARRGKAPVEAPVVVEKGDEDEDEGADEDAAADATAAEGEEGVVGDEGEDGTERESLTIDELAQDVDVVEEEYEELTVLGRVSETVRAASENPGVRNLGALGLFFLASTFAFSCYKVFRKATSGSARRKRTVNKNVEVVERLKNFFPHERGSVNKGVVRGIAMKTGYSSAEIFRKYLRYKLTEEAFTLDFVADVLALKSACALTGEQMKAVLVETGERMFKKYGTLMTDLSGMTTSGVERKIDGAGKFAKLMYLADLEEFIDKEQGEETMLKLKETFGATDEDYNKLRITALGSEDIDLSALQSMMGSSSTATAAAASDEDAKIPIDSDDADE